MATEVKKEQSILDTLKNKKKKTKGDKYWMIPVITIIVSVLVMLSFFVKQQLEDYFDQIEEPFTKTYEETFIKKMENNEDFMVFVYAEWCPFCKQVMFGSTGARSGSGSLKKWTAARGSKINFNAFWEEEKNDTNRAAEFYSNMEKLIEKSDTLQEDNFDWRNKVYKYDEATGATIDDSFNKNSARPGVPAFLYFKGGSLQAVYSGAELTFIGYDYLYKTFVNPNYVGIGS